jgi:predicted nucleotidyltransferase
VEAQSVNLNADLAGRITAVLSARLEILEAYLFGSHAQGAGRAHSDIDIAVFIDDGKAELGPFGYRSELTSVLMSALGTNAVDVVVLNNAPPLLYHRVLRDGSRLFSRNLRATTVREGRALSRHCDFAPHLAKIDAILGGRSPTSTR